MHLNAKRNSYATRIMKLMDVTPKAVLAAIVVSYTMRAEGESIDDQELERSIADEWIALWLSGIVPQKPPKSVWVAGTRNPESDGEGSEFVDSEGSTCG